MFRRSSFKVFSGGRRISDNFQKDFLLRPRIFPDSDNFQKDFSGILTTFGRIFLKDFLGF